MENELVSIGILAYNHAHFMERVLDGIFAQQVSFGLKVYITDDGSQDQTAAIIKQYQSRFPGKIVLFEHAENKGQFAGIDNFIRNAQGKYLCLCDGDDYWIWPHKLQAQVDFLEQHPDYIASCHDAEIRRETTGEGGSIAALQTKAGYKTISQFTTYRGRAIESWELMNGITYIQNCTLLWRRVDLEPYRQLFTSVKFNLDWLLNLVLSMHGKIQYINEAWAVYSDHASGRTKNNYFFNYYFDKIKTLKQLRKLDFFRPLYNRRHIYVLLAKQYNDLLEGTSGGVKTKGFMLRCIFWYGYYSMVSAGVHVRYFLKQREEMRKR